MSNVTDSLSVVGQVEVTGMTHVSVVNSSGSALLALVIQARAGTLPWVTLAGNQVDFYPNPQLPVVQCTVNGIPGGNPYTTPTGQTSTILMDLTGFTEVRVQAASLGTGDVTATAVGSGGGVVVPPELSGDSTLAAAAGGLYQGVVGISGMGVGISVPATASRQTLTSWDTAANALPVGVASDQTADGPQYGTGSVRIIISQGNSTSLFPRFQPNYSAVPVDVTGKYVCIRLKMIVVAAGGIAVERANVGNMTLKLYGESTPNPSAANYLSATFGTMLSGDRMTGDWQTIRIPIEAFGVTGTIADVPAFKQAVRYAGITVAHNGITSDNLRIALSTITVEPKLATKGMVIIGFDDNMRSTFTYAAPIMARYGHVGVLYPGNIRESLGKDVANKMTLREVVALQDQGWQIASQAWSTEAPNMTTAQFHAEMSALHSYYRQLGLTGSVDGSFFSNIGYGNTTYQPVFDSSFRTMRDFMTFPDGARPRPETCPPSHRQMMKSFGVANATNSATNSLIPYIQNAADTLGLAELTWHGLTSADTKFAADGSVLTAFEKTMEWLDQNRNIVEVVTKDTAIRRMAAR